MQKIINSLVFICLFPGNAFFLQASPLEEDYRLALSQAQKTSLPFIVLTRENEDRLTTEIFSVVAQPYPVVADAFTSLSNWCEFLPLHLNVKSCVYEPHDSRKLLKLYLGRKFYQPPEDTYEITYLYQINDKDDSGFEVSLSAAEGPLGTENYQLLIEAEKQENGTLIRVSMAYTSSLLSQLATETYLVTLGSGKIGFSVTGTDDAGQPIFSDGIKAIIERNAMRYYLAMKTYIDTQSLPESQRFEARIAGWFDFSELYARQLHELERDEYLDAKRREWQHQQQLQQEFFSSNANIAD